jgi:signal transduction histidine kinase
VVVRTAPAKDGICVQVSDTGPGIPADVRARIFDPFFTTKEAGKGTGLGLEIVKRIVLRHRGEIRVESVPGRTTFSVRLPLAL